MVKKRAALLHSAKIRTEFVFSSKKFHVRDIIVIGKPPDIVPNDLTGEEYYQLGSWYLDTGQMGQAREALNRAAAQHTNAEAKRKSQLLLACRIPATEVPKEAIELCDQMRMSRLSSPTEAVRVYEQLIAEHPKFERPYKRLAEVRLQEGDVSECIKLLQSVLNINPSYAPAMDVMAQALAASMDYSGSSKFLEQAINSTPDTERQHLLNFRRSLQVVAAMDA